VPGNKRSPKGRPGPARPTRPSTRRQRGRKARPSQTRSPARQASSLDALTHELVNLKRDVAKNLHAMGVRLTRIKEESLWEQGDYSGFDDFLERGVALGRTTAYELIRISRSFAEPVAEQHGYDKLRAAMSWMATAPKEEQTGDVFSSPIKLRDDTGRFETKPMHDATATEIREATEILRETRAGSARITRDVKDRIRRLETQLPEAPRGTQSGQRIRLRRGRDGKIAVTFQAIPLDDLRAFITALERFEK
jgi:hypothetical protein